MISIAVFVLVISIAVRGEDYYYSPRNVTRATNSGIQAYRSALTLDWLAAEDNRQRQVVAAFETEPPAPTRIITTECINYPRPSSGKVAKLMLELLKNLEGDDGVLVPRLIRVLVRSKLLVETSMLDSEPDLDSLVKTPTMMMGEPHVTFPRILAIVWMLVTDATTTKTNGWCPINKVNEYLATTKPTEIAKHMRMLEPVLARARYIMEEFIQRITPLNIYPKKGSMQKTTQMNRESTTEETVDEPDKWTNSSEEDSCQGIKPIGKNWIIADSNSSTLDAVKCKELVKGCPSPEPQRAPEEADVESPQGEYEAKMPRASEDELIKQGGQGLESISTFEPEYASTQFLEQAQQVAKIFEDIAAENKANRLKNIVNILPFLIYILFVLS